MAGCPAGQLADVSTQWRSPQSRRLTWATLAVVSEELPQAKDSRGLYFTPGLEMTTQYALWVHVTRQHHGKDLSVEELILHSLCGYTFEKGFAASGQ